MECTCDAEEDVNTAARTDPAAQGWGAWASQVFPAPRLPLPHRPRGPLPPGTPASPQGCGRREEVGIVLQGTPKPSNVIPLVIKRWSLLWLRAGGRTVRKTTCQTSGQRAAHRPTRAARRPPALGGGHAPFLRLIDDVADLHVQRPVLALQGAVCSLFWKFRKKTGLHFSWNKDPGGEEEGPGPTPLSHQADGLSRQHLWVLLPREYLGGGPGADS